MRVLTLDKRAFAGACNELGQMVAGSGFTPDAIVGIRRGGEYVAEELRSIFPEAEVTFISLQRPSTQSKTGILSRILPMLPTVVLDGLRILEAKVLSIKRVKSVAEASEMELPLELKNQGKKKLLLADDAVDSGVTMSRIAGALHRENPEADLRTAVITVTTSRPLIVPDFSLYNNGTLIRFPWSMDARK